jgi:hypothetical protein
MATPRPEQMNCWSINLIHPIGTEAGGMLLSSLDGYRDSKVQTDHTARTFSIIYLSFNRYPAAKLAAGSLKTISMESSLKPNFFLPYIGLECSIRSNPADCPVRNKSCGG